MQTFLAGLAYCHPLPVNALIRYLSHQGVKVGVRVNSKNEEQCWGVTRSQLPNRGLNTLPTVAESALLPEESSSYELNELPPPRRGGMESAWLWTLALGAGMVSHGERFITSQYQHFPWTPKQHVFNTIVGCTLALYSWLHFPLSHPGCLSTFS